MYNQTSENPIILENNCLDIQECSYLKWLKKKEIIDAIQDENNHIHNFVIQKLKELILERGEHSVYVDYETLIIKEIFFNQENQLFLKLSLTSEEITWNLQLVNIFQEPEDDENAEPIVLDLLELVNSSDSEITNYTEILRRFSCHGIAVHPNFRGIIELIEILLLKSLRDKKIDISQIFLKKKSLKYLGDATLGFEIKKYISDTNYSLSERFIIKGLNSDCEVFKKIKLNLDLDFLREVQETEELANELAFFSFRRMIKGLEIENSEVWKLLIKLIIAFNENDININPDKFYLINMKVDDVNNKINMELGYGVCKEDACRFGKVSLSSKGFREPKIINNPSVLDIWNISSLSEFNKIQILKGYRNSDDKNHNLIVNTLNNLVITTYQNSNPLFDHEDLKSLELSLNRLTDLEFKPIFSTREIILLNEPLTSFTRHTYEELNIINKNFEFNFQILEETIQTKQREDLEIKFKELKELSKNNLFQILRDEWELEFSKKKITNILLELFLFLLEVQTEIILDFYEFYFLSDFLEYDSNNDELTIKLYYGFSLSSSQFLTTLRVTNSVTSEDVLNKLDLDLNLDNISQHLSYENHLNVVYLSQLENKQLEKLINVQDLKTKQAILNLVHHLNSDNKNFNPNLLNLTSASFLNLKDSLEETILHFSYGTIDNLSKKTGTLKASLTDLEKGIIFKFQKNEFTNLLDWKSLEKLILDFQVFCILLLNPLKNKITQYPVSLKPHYWKLLTLLSTDQWIIFKNFYSLRTNKDFKFLLKENLKSKFEDYYWLNQFNVFFSSKSELTKKETNFNLFTGFKFI